MTDLAIPSSATTIRNPSVGEVMTRVDAMQYPDEHPALVYLARLSPGSRRTMREALAVIAAIASGGERNALTLGWAGLRYQHTAAIRAILAARYKPAGVNKHLAALRGVLKEAWQLGQMPAEDYHRAANLPNVKGTTLPTGRALSNDELRALFTTCARDETPAGRRDAAIIGVLYGCGLRRAELVALDLADYESPTGQLIVRSGKGHKDRLVYVRNGSAQALGDWLQIRGDTPGALFGPVEQGGHVIVRRMTAQAVYNMLAKRGREAGVHNFSCHDFRRTHISDLIDGGADLVVVQQLAGHASVTTTARYDRRGDAAKRKASDILHAPYGEEK